MYKRSACRPDGSRSAAGPPQVNLIDRQVRRLSSFVCFVSRWPQRARRSHGGGRRSSKISKAQEDWLGVQRPKQVGWLAELGMFLAVSCPAIRDGHPHRVVRRSTLKSTLSLSTPCCSLIVRPCRDLAAWRSRRCPPAHVRRDQPFNLPFLPVKPSLWRFPRSSPQAFALSCWEENLASIPLSHNY